MIKIKKQKIFKILKILKVFYFYKILKMRKKYYEIRKLIFVFVLSCTKRRCSQIKPQLIGEIEDGCE